MKKIGKVFNKIGFFLKKHRKKIIIGFVSVAVLTTVVQIFWPKDVMLPLSFVGSENISFKNIDSVSDTIKNKISSSKIVLKTENGTKIEVSGESLTKISSINKESLEKQTDYPFTWRFLPFSFIGFRANIDKAELTYETEKLDHFSEEKSADLTKQPENAIFKVDGDKVSIESSKIGATVEASAVEDSLKNSAISVLEGQELVIDSKKVEPEIQTDDYTKLKDLAEKAISKNIYFMLPIGNRIDKFATTAEERASLLDVKKDENGNYSLTLKEDEMSKVFSALEEKIKKEPGVTIVKTINGSEVGRTQGISGQGLDFDDFKSQLSGKLFEDDGEQIDLKIKIIQPTVRYDRQFTNSNEGLQSYLNEVTNGKKITVSVQQLSGNYWSASSGGDTRMTSASTYKLYIAQYIMNKIDNGQLSWDSNTDACFNSMIIRSANDCAENWINTYGRSNINSYLTSLGYGSVFSNSGAAASTTANDLKNMLTNLYFGDNFSAGNAQKLKDLMSSQVYRQGIPSGTSSVVSDKVGFLDGVLNDAGIVYHPQGNYVIVVMTEGESWAKIAEITRGVEQIMYP